MEDDGFSQPTATTRPRLYSIVHTYIQKQLPRNIHPAFKALRDREEASTIVPQICFTEETTLPLLAETQRSGIDQVDGKKKNDDDDDDDLPLYALLQGRSRSIVDSVKRRAVQRCCE